ncbi:MAG: M23 family metallopeptidase [Flavobacteriia bacterium]|jgi:murein DD-endopeptidase MepM/ murein hydrolase activator NlpD|nr:M23 family metallopeptidase [Flavobacteriia bacterium]
MATQEKKKKTLRKKLFNPYRMVIVNEETFEEQIQVRISRIGIFLLSLFVLVTLSAGIFALIAYTPMKEYIPGYDSNELRKKATQNLFVTDSLIEIYNQNLQYLNAVRAVWAEDVDYQDPETSDLGLNDNEQNDAEPISIVPEDSLLRAFVAQQEKYNPNISSELELNDLLLPPALGPISQGFNTEENHFAVDIVLKQNTPIKSIADGTVIFSEWTAQTGFVIIIEHSFGVLSAYKHNASLTKSQGESVLAGEVIASAGNTGELSTGFHLHFELWIEGYPMNPENFFNFTQP